MLNIGLSIVVVMYAIVGFFGYVKYGEEVLGSITLNIPNNEKYVSFNLFIIFQKHNIILTGITFKC